MSLFLDWLGTVFTIMLIGSNVALATVLWLAAFHKRDGQ